jgi:hypothetical protein
MKKILSVNHEFEAFLKEIDSDGNLIKESAVACFKKMPEYIVKDEIQRSILRWMKTAFEAGWDQSAQNSIDLLNEMSRASVGLGKDNRTLSEGYEISARLLEIKHNKLKTPTENSND